MWIYHRNPKLKILPSQYQGLVGDTELTQLAPGAEIIPEEKTWKHLQYSYQVIANNYYETMTKCEAATLKFSAPGIITMCEVIIVRYNAIIYQ